MSLRLALRLHKLANQNAAPPSTGKSPAPPAGPPAPVAAPPLANTPPPSVPKTVGTPQAVQRLDTYVQGKNEEDVAERTKAPQQAWANSLAAKAKPLTPAANSDLAKALAYKPKRDWASTDYATGAPTDPAQRVMSTDGQWALNKDQYRAQQTAGQYPQVAPAAPQPVTPSPAVARNTAILDRNKQESAAIDKQVLQSRLNRENTAAEHAQGFADLHARLDRANAALDAPSRAGSIMQQPIQPAKVTPQAQVPTRRTFNQLMSLYNNAGAGSGMWSPGAYEAMVDEAGSTTDKGRDDFLTSGIIQDFKRRHR